MRKDEIYGRVRERMIRYACVDTQSQPYEGTWPTTAKQRDLGKMLAEELRTIGVPEVYYDEPHCVVYGRIPSNLPEGTGRAIGFIAHMDTAPDASGTDVKPWVLEHYDGGDILLNEEKQILMRAADYPNLQRYVGQDLILTDGTTLLGGDDKASISAIMTLAEYYCSNPEIPHGDISLAFTPDEEVGGLAQDLDFERFGARVAYTLDGDHLGEYQDETFYASEAIIEITGRSVHTGTAKGIMVNASDLAVDIAGALPKQEKPQYTEGREGFFHLISLESSCERAVLTYIIRDFDKALFTEREELLRRVCAETEKAHPDSCVKITITHQYSNMKEKLTDVPELVEILRKAIAESGITPVTAPFRGGTDGAALSFRGLPCPNLSAGYENAHGRFEYVPVQSMEKNVEILMRICDAFAKQSPQ